MALSNKKRMEKQIAALADGVVAYAEVREAAIQLVEALRASQPKSGKSIGKKLALENMEVVLLDTARCGCGRYPSYTSTLRGGMCENCMSS
jgi:hypothetical protein